MQNTKIKSVDNRIHCSDIAEVEKQAKYYRKMQKIEQSRKQQRRIS
jgi:hypothetical protein